MKLATARPRRIAEGAIRFWRWRGWRGRGRVSQLAVAGLALCAALVYAVASDVTSVPAATILAGLPVPASQLPFFDRAGTACPELSPPQLAAQVMTISRFNPHATTAGGGSGIAGLTAAQWRRWKPGPGIARTDIAANILALAHDDCNLAGEVRAAGVPGDRWRLALAAFDVGLRTVISAHGIPASADSYVTTVAAYAAWYEQQAQFGGKATPAASPSPTATATPTPTGSRKASSPKPTASPTASRSASQKPSQKPSTKPSTKPKPKPGPPVITQVTPATPAAGASVTLTGENFGSVQGASYLTLAQVGTSWGTPSDGDELTIAAWSKTSVTFTLPSSTGPFPLEPGPATISVSVDGQTSAARTITVGGTVGPTPVITSVTPSTATAGTSVTLAGENFGSAQGSGYVTLVQGGTSWGTPYDGAQLTIASWSNTSVTFTLPPSTGSFPLQPGTATITVTAGVTSYAESITITS